MTPRLFSSMLVASSCLATVQDSAANDLVNLLRALQGLSHDHHTAGHHGDHDVRHRTARRHRISQSANRSGVSFSLSFGTAPVVATVPAYHAVPPQPDVLTTAPAPQQLHHLPHHLGEIMTCPVPLETCVCIKDADEIAPTAIPVAVAVRDPHLGLFGSRRCVEALVYVEVLVPPCSLQRLRVSPWRTKIRLDYGHHAIDIISRNGVARIDYDD